MTDSKPPIKDNVFSPTDIKEKTLHVIGERILDKLHDRKKVIVTGIPSLDKILLPMRPAEIIGVLGYTSNFKTGLMNNIARHNANELSYPDAIIRFDWEQSVEEQGVIDLAQISKIDATKMMRGELDLEAWDALQKAAEQREKLPMWLVGHSSEGHRRRARMSMNDVAVAMEYMVEKLGIVPRLVLLDYLQRIRRTLKETREGFMDIVDRSKDLGIAFHCPVMLGCQAKRDVKKRGKWRMPRADDAQETSNFEQTMDKMLSVWMPKNDWPEKTELPYANKLYTVTDNQLLLSIIKQKFGESPRLVELFITHETSEIYSLTKEEES